MNAHENNPTLKPKKPPTNKPKKTWILNQFKITQADGHRKKAFNLKALNMELTSYFVTMVLYVLIPCLAEHGQDLQYQNQEPIT